MQSSSRPSQLIRLTVLICVVASLQAAAAAQCLRIAKVDVTNNKISLKNVGSETQPAGYWLCNFPNYSQIDQSVSAGETIVVSLFAGFLTADDGEVGLYSSDLFDNETAIMDYMQYGETGHRREGVADDAGVWSKLDFVVLPPSGAMRWTGAACDDPGSSSAWGAIVASESRSLAAMKALYD